MTLLAVNDLTVRYGRLTALRGISLKIAEGEILFVTGPNGAGKSTLLNAIAGVVPPISGSITLDGAEVTGVPPESIARQGFSLVPEGRNVFGALSIEENLKVGAGMRTDRQKVADDLESVYGEFPMLAERRHAPAGMLSGGQQQMLVIGRALMTSPRLMAIDEPSLGLAPKIIDQVYEILMRLRAQRKLTLLIVEQSSTRAMMTGGRMILMRGGRIVLEGPAGDHPVAGWRCRGVAAQSDARRVHRSGGSNAVVRDPVAAARERRDAGRVAGDLRGLGAVHASGLLAGAGTDGANDDRRPAGVDSWWAADLLFHRGDHICRWPRLRTDLVLPAGRHAAAQGPVRRAADDGHVRPCGRRRLTCGVAPPILTPRL